MAMTPEEQQAVAQRSSRSVTPTDVTGWVGWIAFAAIMMVMLGAFHIIQGLVALFSDSYYLVGHNGLVLQIDYTAWGWIHVIGGIVVLIAGYSLFAGRTWARIVAVIVAMVSAFVNVGFLGAYPIWSTMMIVLDVLVIWALVVHGDEMSKT